MADNIVLGREPRKWRVLLDRSERDRQAAQALDVLGCGHIPLDAEVQTLGIAQQQMVEIARAMLSTPQVLVLDEPTATLTSEDMKHLFQVIHRLRDQGVAIIYISHFLEECQEIADRYVVLRDGQSVASGLMADVRHDELVAHMVGREVTDLYPTRKASLGDVLFEAVDIRSPVHPKPISLQVHRGEVLGNFGLIGSGRSELLRLLFGLDAPDDGAIRLQGEPTGGRGLDAGP